MSDSAVAISEMTFGYAKDAGPVLDIASWALAKNEHVFLSGASGSGKSTLLNLIAGTLSPSTGEISLLGSAFSSLSASKRDALRAEHIGIVFQQLNLIPYLTVHDNIKLAAHFAKNKQPDIESRISALLEQLALPLELLHRHANQLSMGQQQRVAIARALINQPELLIVDEPTSALDQQARDAFMKVLMQSAANSAMIFVSHDVTLSSYFSRHDKLTEINRVHPQEVISC